MKTTMLVVTAFVLATAMPIRAHHAFGGEFDANRPVLLKGAVVKVEWVNPHAWIHIEVTDPDGSKKEWMVEGGTPNTLLRANGRNVTYPDGRKLFLGSSGTGAPTDGADPADAAKPPTGRGRGGR